MKTTPRSRVRVASGIAVIGWMLLWMGNHRPHAPAAYTLAYGGLVIGEIGVLLTVAAALGALAESAEDGAYGAIWLGGVVGGTAVVLWIARLFHVPFMAGFGELGYTPAPDWRSDTIDHMVWQVGWVAAATVLVALAILFAARRRAYVEAAKSRLAGG